MSVRHLWALALFGLSAFTAAQAPPEGESAPDYAEVEPGGDDPLSTAVTDGIVWYGTWEDAMAEKERTGKPVMLHFGSPRCPEGGCYVPGTW